MGVVLLKIHVYGQNFMLDIEDGEAASCTASVMSISCLHSVLCFEGFAKYQESVNAEALDCCLARSPYVTVSDKRGHSVQKN